MSEHTNAGSVNLLPPVNIGLYLPTSTSPVEMVAIDNIVNRMNEEIFLCRKRQKTTFIIADSMVNEADGYLTGAMKKKLL